MRIKITVEQDNALTIKSDVLALKYAQHLYGVDKSVVTVLSQDDKDLLNYLPEVNKYRFIDSRAKLGAKAILFLGVYPPYNFQYKEIREFGRRVMIVLSIEI